MKQHLVIAGTGRAGTSFLVQYLTECGLETNITRNPLPGFDENANAGFEDVPLTGADLPYVIKSPWLYEFVDRLLAQEDIRLDAVIVPMRDIVEAASSRVILELQKRYGGPYGQAELTEWETWAETPGGVVYSLNPLDQARILAMGFHETIRALVRQRVPIVFIDFPRMIDDEDYLWDVLEPVIGSKIGRDDAIAAHRRTADPQKVRTGSELQRDGGAQDAPVRPVIGFPSFDTLDKTALLRELTRLRKQCDASDAALEQNRQTCLAQDEQVRQAQQQVSALFSTIESQQASIRLLNENDTLRASREREESEEIERLRAAASQCMGLQDRLSETEANWRRTVDALKDSTSWKITRPIRWLGTHLRRH